MASGNAKIACRNASATAKMATAMTEKSPADVPERRRAPPATTDEAPERRTAARTDAVTTTERTADRRFSR
jgi:hypothetical protein